MHLNSPDMPDASLSEEEKIYKIGKFLITNANVLRHCGLSSCCITCRVNSGNSFLG